MRFDQAISGLPVHYLTTAWAFESFTVACKFKTFKTLTKSCLTDFSYIITHVQKKKKTNWYINYS